MLMLFYMVSSAIFQGCISTTLFNCTVQFIFKNETWNADYANQSSSAYFDKRLQITNSLKTSLGSILSVISVTNLSNSNNFVVATVVTGTNVPVNITIVNSALENLNAAVVEPSLISTCGVSMSTTPPINTDSRSISSMLQGVTTMPPMSTSQNSFLNSTINTMITNLNSTTPNTLSTNPSTFTNSMNNTNIYSTMTALSSVIIGSSTISTNNSNTTEIGTNFSTTQSNITTDKATSPRSDYYISTSTGASTTPSNTSSTNTVNTFSSSNNAIVTMTSAERNGSTSALGVSVTTPLPNTFGSKTSQSSSVINSTAMTISINVSDTVKGLNGSTISITTLCTTCSLQSTRAFVSLTNYSLRFKYKDWIPQYKLPENKAYIDLSIELKNKISAALNLSSSVVAIYSFEEGSVIALTGIPSYFTPEQINIRIQNLDAAIVTQIIPSSSTILPIFSTTTQTPTFPTYAIILISIFATALFIIILFVITALICRHRRLKGYGRHQVQFFEMENGWKYGTRNQSYHE